MKAVQLSQYEREPKLVDVPEPQITSPLDVLVRVGGAGVCRTDLHIIDGQWQEKSGVELPYTLGHENAGWVQDVGSAVTNVAVGDTVRATATKADLSGAKVLSRGGESGKQLGCQWH